MPELLHFLAGSAVFLGLYLVLVAARDWRRGRAALRRSAARPSPALPYRAWWGDTP